MEWPDNKATCTTEHIMKRIHDRLKEDEKNFPIHYNYVFERIHEILTEAFINASHT